MSNEALRQHLTRLLDWEDAHTSFDSAVEDVPPAAQGKKHAGAPHTLWQLLEHLRICQFDILDFSRNPDYREVKFEDYWPKAAAPPEKDSWKRSVAAYRRDREALKKLAADPQIDLFARIPHGTGQTYLRELLLVADHNAYHVAQIVLLRRLLGVWK
jgi:uncharacterized damage-inducible protein DinB